MEDDEGFAETERPVTPPSLDELQRGKPTPSTDLPGLLRDRRIGRLSGVDVDRFIEDEAEQPIGTNLPDLSEYLEARQQFVGDESDEEYYRIQRPGQEEESINKALLKGLRKTATEPKRSSDWFDYGLGGLVKRSVYFLGFLAVLWEIYLNSPFFERALPPAPVVF
ncbi:hypothetical protein JKP88DRAFT_241833 [Tribonema minus]|uniref:Uncharacterized protein n=1 Tax=Tribonema minus TaxID=303371 RepID=A0A835YTQ6_9STRA|nr:hypothetical protein JKP88DRAFT_241833 [Tribonema minus]